MTKPIEINTEIIATMTIAVENARKKRGRIEKDTRKRVNIDDTNGVMTIAMMKAVIAAFLD